jgi:transposase
MASKTANRFSPEVRARAVRLVFEHEKDHASRWASVTSIAAKIGCTAQSLNEWVKKAQVDSGARAGVPTEIAERLKALERENRELRQANEILRKASAYFAHARLGACGSQLSNRLRALTGERRNSEIARNLTALAMAIGSNPLSSNTKSAEIDVISSARE